MAEVEERLLRMDDFEDIVTCLKMDPATWSDDKLRGLLTASYLSSVSEDEIQLAGKSVTAESLHAVHAVNDSAQGTEGLQSSGDNVAHSSQCEVGAAIPGTHKPSASSLEGPESMQALGGIDDLMKHELDQLTWAGPSGEGQSADTAAMASVKDPHVLLRLSGGVAAPAFTSVDSAQGQQTADAAETETLTVQAQCVEPEAAEQDGHVDVVA